MEDSPREIEEQLDIRGGFPLLDAIAAKEGWDDPEMYIYNDFARDNTRPTNNILA